MPTIQPKYCSYFNPCAKEHLDTHRLFKKLSGSKKAQVILATVFAGVASFFMGGLGGLATFRHLVKKWTILNPITKARSKHFSPKIDPKRRLSLITEAQIKHGKAFGKQIMDDSKVLNNSVKQIQKKLMKITRDSQKQVLPKSTVANLKTKFQKLSVELEKCQSQLNVGIQIQKNLNIITDLTAEKINLIQTEQFDEAIFAPMDEEIANLEKANAQLYKSLWEV